jgi:hypothetical protein
MTAAGAATFADHASSAVGVEMLSLLHVTALFSEASPFDGFVLWDEDRATDGPRRAHDMVGTLPVTEGQKALLAETTAPPG